MKSVLITGANRGLGLGMVNYLTKNNKAEIIFAACRKPSEELNKISQEYKNVHIVHLDVKDSTNMQELASEIAKVVGDQGLNVLINNAGVSAEFTELHLMKEEQLVENLTINTMAPILMTQAFLPLLKQASKANSDKPMGPERAVVIHISSILGSIARNDQGGFYPYRCSKAALNAATKSMSIDLKKDQILVASMHPGWVRTEMGGEDADIDVNTSINGIFSTIEKLKEADNGTFLQFDGTTLPW